MVAPTGAPDELPIDVDLIKVLASDSRRDILRLLGERRRTLTELADAIGLKKATVLEHLQKLVAADLIRKLDGDERLWVYYELTPRGKRLVRPERTRFYLILGGTAAAALVLGAILATAFLAGPGQNVLADDQATFQDARGPSLPPILWRGLDDDLTIALPGAPSQAELSLRAEDGTRVTIPIENESATLRAATLDTVPPGTYALAYASSAGESLLPGTLRIEDPQVALFPLAIPANAASSVEVALAPPNLAAPVSARILVNGNATEAQGVPLRVEIGPGPSDAHVRVGRLASTTLVAVPDLGVVLHKNESELVLHATAEGAPLADADVLLDGARLGRTNATGALLTPWPQEGPRALRIVASDGRAQERAIQFTTESAFELPPALRLDAFDARGPAASGFRARADIFNDGPAVQLVTVAAREHGSLLASALVLVPANGRAEVLLESPLARPETVDITAHAARTQVMPRTQSMATSESNATADGMSMPMVAAPPTSSDWTMDRYYAFSPADASDTLVFPVAPSPAAAGDATGAPSARAPMPSPLVLLAFVALAAWAFRARR